MALQNVKQFLLRFNLDNEQHAMLYNRLMELNPDIYKSKTQYIMDSMGAFQNRNDIPLVIKNEKEFLEEVNKETENAIARVLGQFLLGSMQARINEPIKQEITEQKEEVKNDEVKNEGITNPKIQNLMNSWYDD